ncbi:hypothetical protein P691DRAFT_508376 [Macrolepiota fuliginosa MF-IS2]|uniref:Uncharacterized protein n=1 Tax=Macrolepiota fuliginosa MF-IS2 TaxID=1400762 RepID=A0A9P5XFF4_9AGAR|nr:hypothetical protein P691DRAFT_508376 [Macrolepiota fuliginosa MF-IS2]
MQWTLRRLRSRARLNSSDPLCFRSRMIPYKKVGLTGQAELLSGGRWMISVHEDGSGCVTDLDQEQPQPQILFTTFRSGEDSLRDSCTWVDREGPSESLHVAVFNRQMRANREFS